MSAEPRICLDDSGYLLNCMRRVAEKLRARIDFEHPEWPEGIEGCVNDAVDRGRGREDQNSIWAWVLETFGRPTPERSIDRMGEEVLELLEQMVARDQPIEDVLAECADVVICMYAVFASSGHDLQAWVDEKMAVNRARKWRRNGDGTGYHVREGE